MTRPQQRPRRTKLTLRADETYEQWAKRIPPMPDHLVRDIAKALRADQGRKAS